MQKSDLVDFFQTVVTVPRPNLSSLMSYLICEGIYKTYGLFTYMSYLCYPGTFPELIVSVWMSYMCFQETYLRLFVPELPELSRNLSSAKLIVSLAAAWIP